MISEKQRLANIKNSRLAGVKTIHGKKISRYNATKHGILKSAFNNYEKSLFKTHLEILKEELIPVGLIESNLVIQIAYNYVRLLRVKIGENEFIKSVVDPYFVEQLLPGGKPIETGLDGLLETKKHGFKPTLPQSATDGLNNTFLRYESAIENKIYRALKELKQLQEERKDES